MSRVYLNFNSGPPAVYTAEGLTGYGESDTGFIAPVELPDGAIVTEFCIDAIDSRTNDISATLGRTSLSTDGTNTMGLTFTSGTSSSVQRPCISPIDFSQVNNSSFAYWILVKLFHNNDNAGAHRLISAQVTRPLP